jgi:hypothetical protein
MRMLLIMSIPVEARNAAAKAGTLSLASERMLWSSRLTTRTQQWLVGKSEHGAKRAESRRSLTVSAVVSNQPATPRPASASKKPVYPIDLTFVI